MNLLLRLPRLPLIEFVCSSVCSVVFSSFARQAPLPISAHLFTLRLLLIFRLMTVPRLYALLSTLMHLRFSLCARQDFIRRLLVCAPIIRRSFSPFPSIRMNSRTLDILFSTHRLYHLTVNLRYFGLLSMNHGTTSDILFRFLSFIRL
jgi:hypothetical protein